MSSSSTTMETEYTAEQLAELAGYNANPLEAFHTGCYQVVYFLWDTLRMAVEYGWCSNPQEKRDFLYNDILDMFDRAIEKKSKVYKDELEKLFEQALAEDFHTQTEDGSTQWVAVLLCTLFDDCMVKKDFTGLMKLLEREPNECEVVEEGDSDEEGDDDDEGDEEGDSDVEMGEKPAPPPKPPKHQVDEDGWETVQKKGGRR